MFMKPSVEYLGYCLSAQGLHPLESKKNAIVHALETQNIKQLHVGLLNFYAKLISNLATF